MESINFEQIDTIKSKFDPAWLEEYCHAKIGQYGLSGIYMDACEVTLKGYVIFANPEEICWRRAKRVLFGRPGSEVYDFYVKVDKYTGQCIKPEVN